jgi:hypothetical protein
MKAHIAFHREEPLPGCSRGRALAEGACIAEKRGMRC